MAQYIGERCGLKTRIGMFQCRLCEFEHLGDFRCIDIFPFYKLESVKKMVIICQRVVVAVGKNVVPSAVVDHDNRGGRFAPAVHPNLCDSRDFPSNLTHNVVYDPIGDFFVVDRHVGGSIVTGAFPGKWCLRQS